MLKLRKNGYYFFMLQRKKEMISKGYTFTRGLTEVSDLIHGEWTKMTPSEKQVYFDMAAKQWLKDNKDKPTASSSKSTEEMAGAASKTPIIQHKVDFFKIEVQNTKKRLTIPTNEHQRLQDFNELLTPIRKKFDPKRTPVLILNFSMYNDEPLEELLVAEVALSVFTIESGLLHNFATLVDPGKAFSKNLSDTVKANAQRLALPYPNYDAQAQKYIAILDRIFQIGQMYAGFYNGKVVFHCLDHQATLTELGLKWLMQRSGIYGLSKWEQFKYEFQLLPLEFTICELSFNHYKNVICPPLINKLAQETVTKSKKNAKTSSSIIVESPTTAPELEKMLSEMKKETEKYTYYPRGLRKLPDVGVFFRPEDVLQLLLEGNYGHYDELACTYHMKRKDGVFFCPLNVVNRFAFSLLQCLAISFKVVPKPGVHYPTLTPSKSEEEKGRRRRLLQRWEIFDASELGRSEASKDPELNQIWETLDTNNDPGTIEASDIPEELDQGWGIFDTIQLGTIEAFENLELDP